MVVRPRMVGGLFCNFKPTRCTADIQTARTPDSLIARCGTGFKRADLLKAAGEALERQFSFSEQGAGLATGRLSDLPMELAEWFGYLFSDANQEDLADWSFQLDKMRLSGEATSVLGPVLPHTLGQFEDDRFMPIRDSSGCALHSSKAAAEAGARRELYERQSLTAFWYFNHVNFAWEPNDDLLPRISASLQRMVDVLRALGRVILFDISLVRPYRVVLAVFVSKQGKVVFSSGAAADLSLQDAMTKAVIELYQAFVLMDQLVDCSTIFLSEDGPVDEISNYYLKCNNAQTVNDFLRAYDAAAIGGSIEGAGVHWRADASDCSELTYIRSLRFGGERSSLFFCSIHLVRGFPTMSPMQKYPTASALASQHFGLGQPHRDSQLPFG
jgi:hypothetical protein